MPTGPGKESRIGGHVANAPLPTLRICDYLIYNEQAIIWCPQGPILISFSRFKVEH